MGGEHLELDPFSLERVWAAGGDGKPNCQLDRDFAVDELAVINPIWNAIFDPIPIVAEETDSFVRGRIGKPYATCATPPIAHGLEVNLAVSGPPF
jgi:hypothetical protein